MFPRIAPLFLSRPSSLLAYHTFINPNSHQHPPIALCFPVAWFASSMQLPPPTDGPPALAAKRKPPLKVGTHNGTFHCDEALGCFMLRLTDRFSDADIVRTRDQKILNTLDAVLDVGGVYDPENYRFDHHQRGFECTFGHGFTTKLSSAGLVYKHFGREIVAKELQLEPAHPDVDHVYLAVYRNFMEAIDAIDNGVNQYDTENEPRYVNNTHLSSRVGKLNLDWMVESSSEKEDEAFAYATQVAGGEFQEAVRYHAKSWLPARVIVANFITTRSEVDLSEQIILLKQFVPWKEHIFELERELHVELPIIYVLYQDDRNWQWRVQAVATAPGRFDSRKPLPAAWRGLTGTELSKVVGIDDCVFVHSSGFIGGHISFDGALKMARKALKSDYD